MYLGNNGFASASAGIKPLHFAQVERQSKDMILLALPANIHHLRRATCQALFSLPRQMSSVKEQKLSRSFAEAGTCCQSTGRRLTSSL